MKFNQIIAGAIAGAIGAAIWSAVAYYANIETGFIAWGIGFLVGLAIAVTGENSSLAGVTAVTITIVSLLGGKYASMELSVQSMRSDLSAVRAQTLDPDAEVTDDALQSHLSRKIAEKREASGENILWPEPTNNEQDASASFPEDIWREAGEQLRGKTEDEKEKLRIEINNNVREWAENFEQLLAEGARENWLSSSFSMYDIVFFGLAVATAWRIASRDEEGEAA
jgi:hypothetical protein